MEDVKQLKKLINAFIDSDINPTHFSLQIFYDETILIESLLSNIDKETFVELNKFANIIKSGMTNNHKPFLIIESKEAKEKEE
jgi:hypothetical protein